jgi:hypothetical protein
MGETERDWQPPPSPQSQGALAPKRNAPVGTTPKPPPTMKTRLEIVREAFPLVAPAGDSICLTCPFSALCEDELAERRQTLP